MSPKMVQMVQLHACDLQMFTPKIRECHACWGPNDLVPYLSALASDFSGFSGASEMASGVKSKAGAKLATLLVGHSCV